MAQEYKLRSFEKGDFTDPHGNYWCTAAFDGVGEPVKWVVKAPSRVKEGESYYGEIKEMTSKAGKPYLRFYKQQLPDGGGGSPAPSSDSPKPSQGGYRDNSDGMKQGMCFNNATLFVNLMFEMNGEKPSPEDWASVVYAHAAALYAKGDLKTIDQVQQVKDAFHADAVTTDVGDDGINLDDIPF